MNIDDDLNFEDSDESNEINEPSPEEALENEARSMGWKPLEEFEGPETKWRSAKEFVDRSSFFKKIETQNQTIQELKVALKELGKHQSSIAKLEREKAIRELTALKKEAFESSDFDAMQAVDDQLIALKSAPAPEVRIPEPSQEDNNALFADFKERNPWYDSDPELRELADTIAMGYAAQKVQSNQQVNPTELFDYVEKQVKKQKGTQTKKMADPVHSSRQTTNNQNSRSGKKFTVSDLTPLQRKMATRFKESGAFKTEQEYVDSLVEIGELK